jgi:ribosome-associated toxin RatA of RatAB toxin-antitoxin module
MLPWPSLAVSPILRATGRTVIALLLIQANAVLAADSPIRSLDVAFDGETYIVNADIFAPVPQSVAFDVLTDFDNLAKWVPNVTDSKAIKRDDTSVIVEQRGVARYGAASFPYTTQRKIDLKPPSAIKTAQIKGNMRRVESTLAIEPEGKGTKIAYHLEIVPSAFAGAVMSKKFVEHEVVEQFGAIVGEMTRRAP